MDAQLKIMSNFFIENMEIISCIEAKVYRQKLVLSYFSI